MAVRMVKPHIVAAQDSNPKPMRQDKQLQVIHPARRAARASNPMQVKHTQARIVRQMQVRQITVRMVKPHIVAAQDSNPIPMRQDKQLQVIHPARRITPKHSPYIVAAQDSNPIPARQDKQLQVIHPARRAARASNPMQVKHTQARIVRQVPVTPT